MMAGFTLVGFYKVILIAKHFRCQHKKVKVFSFRILGEGITTFVEEQLLFI